MPQGKKIHPQHKNYSRNRNTRFSCDVSGNMSDLSNPLAHSFEYCTSLMPEICRVSCLLMMWWSWSMMTLVLCTMLELEVVARCPDHIWSCSSVSSLLEALILLAQPPVLLLLTAQLQKFTMQHLWMFSTLCFPTLGIQLQLLILLVVTVCSSFPFPIVCWKNVCFLLEYVHLDLFQKYLL